MAVVARIKEIIEIRTHNLCVRISPKISPDRLIRITSLLIYDDYASGLCMYHPVAIQLS